MFTERLIIFCTSVIRRLSLLGVFILMVFESACIPIPSEIVVPFAGYVFCYSLLDIILLSTITSIANLVGSLVAYEVGYTLGVKVLRWFESKLLLGREVKEAEEFFSKHGLKAVFISRMLPAVRTFISLPAGVFKVDRLKFTIYTLLGSIPWNLMLASLGYTLRSMWIIIVKYSKVADIIVILAIIGLIAYYTKKSRQGKG